MKAQHLIIIVTAVIVTTAIALSLNQYDQLVARDRSVGAIYSNDCEGTDTELGMVAMIANNTGQLPDGTRLGDGLVHVNGSACSAQ